MINILIRVGSAVCLGRSDSYYEDEYYHVMNRDRGYQRIFHQNEDYGAFLKTLAEARQRFGLEIHAYQA